MSVKMNSLAFRAMTGTHVRLALERASIAGLGRLEQNIQAGERSGIHHSENPRQSSDPNEYPQEQTGALLNSLDFQIVSDFQAVIGAMNNVPDYAHKLEFDPLEFGGRRWLSRTFEENETRDAILDAAKG